MAIRTYRGTCSIKVEYTTSIQTKPGTSWLDAQLLYIENLKAWLDTLPLEVLAISYPMMTPED